MTRLALHQSTLSTLSKCGMQAYYRYVEGRKVPPGIAQLVGTATHKSHEENLKHKARTGTLLPRDAVVQFAVDTIDERIASEGLLLDDEERERGQARVVAEAKDQSVALADICATAFAPRIEVTDAADVEHKFVLEVPGFDCDLEGQLDVYERRRRTIRDTKTSKSRPNADDLAGNIQTQFYAFAGRAAWPNEAPERVAMDVAVKTKTPQAHTLEAPVPTDFTPLLKRIEAAGQVFRTGSFYPTDPSGPNAWVCSQKFCGFYDSICAYGRRARVQVAATQIL